MHLTPPTVITHPADAAHFGGPWDGARAIVLHHTGGTNSLDWLSTTPGSQVSVHALIDKRGVIYRLVPDGKNAWHVGRSALGNYARSAPAGSCNEICLGIELENKGTGRDPYPPEQIDACGWQIAQWWNQWGDLPILTHKLIDTTGKTDPAGLDLRIVLRRALLWYDA